MNVKNQTTLETHVASLKTETLREGSFGQVANGDCNLLSARSELTVRYFRKFPNWGDALNPYLLKRLLPTLEIFGTDESQTLSEDHLLAIGSVVHWSTPHSVIWGTGAIHSSLLLTHIPKLVLAVRGPLTQKMLLEQGINCPSIFGDPAGILPEFYSPASRRGHKYPLGVIPHYVDKNCIQVAKLREQGAKIIDVFSDIEYFVDELASCECIVSSSLHGLICADAYSVPSAWITLSDGVIGDGFKFQDYYLSKGCNVSPIPINGTKSIKLLIDKCRLHGRPINARLLKESLFDYISKLYF